LVNLFGLEYDVIHVSLDGLFDEIIKTLEHTSLVCCSSVFQSKRHADVAIRSERCDEKSHELVGLFHRNLMVAGIRIKEAEDFAP
jgi:hypothetical protein